MHTECTYKQPQHIMAPICLAIMSSGIKYVIVSDNTFGKRKKKHIKKNISAAISISIAKLSEEIKWEPQVIEMWHSNMYTTCNENNNGRTA